MLLRNLRQLTLKVFTTNSEFKIYTSSCKASWKNLWNWVKTVKILLCCCWLESFTDLTLRMRLLGARVLFKQTRMDFYNPQGVCPAVTFTFSTSLSLPVMRWVVHLEVLMVVSIRDHWLLPVLLLHWKPAQSLMRKAKCSGLTIYQSKVKAQSHKKRINKKNISPKLLSNPVKSWIQRILNLWICPLDEIMMIIYTHQCER